MMFSRKTLNRGLGKVDIPADANCFPEELSMVVVLEYSACRIFIQIVDDLDQWFIVDVVSPDLSQAIVPYQVESLLKVDEVVV